MKIYRDGKEFELTFSEMMQAHDEYEHHCAIEDIESILESGTREVELSGEQISEVASFALCRLNKNDNYFESYWMTIEDAIDDYINNLPNNEEEEE